jgi:hypothetical protein
MRYDGKLLGKDVRTLYMYVLINFDMYVQKSVMMKNFLEVLMGLL